MNEGADKVKLSEQDQRKTSTSKGDSEDQVQPRAPIHRVDTPVQLTASIIETNSYIDMTSKSNETEISVLPTLQMDDSNISAQSSASMNHAVQLTDSIIEPDSSIHLTCEIITADTSSERNVLMTEADISVQPTTLINEADTSVQATTSMNVSGLPIPPATSMKDADISVEATILMDEADISVQPTYPSNIKDLTARINKVKISFQSTVPMTVAIIPGQSSAVIRDAGSFVESIHEADTIAQPSDQIKEADTTVQPTEQIDEDLSSTEEYQKAFRIFQWIEMKLDLLKTVQGIDDNADNDAQNEHRDLSLNEKSTLLERMLEEISQQMTSTNIAEKDGYFSKEVTRMLNMLQETTVEMLDSFKVSKNTRPTIKVLAILFHHLVANVGSQVTFHDVQTRIDGQRVMNHFTDVQIAREPRYLKMSIVKSNLELGIRRAQYLKRKSRWYKSKAEWIHSEEFARTAGVQSANQQLKTFAKESEEILKTYAKVVKFVLIKAKVFMTLKIDNEDVLGYFLTREIHDMYKEEI